VETTVNASSAPTWVPTPTPAPLPKRMVEFVREMIHEQLKYRELLLTLASRDIRSRYKHSLIGVGWAVFVPFFMMLILAAVMGRFARSIDMGNIPRPIFILCAYVPWQFFEQSVIKASGSLVTNRNLVTKVYFAREVLPFAAILTAGFDFLIASMVLAAMMAWFKIAPSWTIAFVPVLLLVQLAFTAGVALLLSMLNLFYRDVGQVIGVMMRAWFFLSPILYKFPETGAWRILRIVNPMAPLLQSYRDVVVSGQVPNWASLGPAAAIAVLALVVSWTAFHASEFRFAENV